MFRMHLRAYFIDLQNIIFSLTTLKCFLKKNFYIHATHIIVTVYTEYGVNTNQKLK